jgi:hypothetical protein
MQVRGFRLSSKKGDFPHAIYSGEVNAKNRMGGYVGFVPFFVEFDTEIVSLFDSRIIDGSWQGIPAAHEVIDLVAEHLADPLFRKSFMSLSAERYLTVPSSIQIRNLRLSSKKRDFPHAIYCGEVHPPSEVMDSTHFWRRFRGSGQ